MATVNKDFKVKHGLDVNQGGTFGGTVTVATPTENTHAATKLYVDSSLTNFKFSTSSSAPATPVAGQAYVDSDTGRLTIYINSAWVEFATITDSYDIRQHIHDTSIDGTGIVVSIFQDGGFYDTQFDSDQDAGYYDFNEWAMIWNGGVAIDNFN